MALLATIEDRLGLGWSIDLEVPDSLKKLRLNKLKDMYGIQQKQFNYIQKQLLITGCVGGEVGQIFTAIKCPVPPKAYRMVLHKCTSEGAFKMLIWIVLCETTNLSSACAKTFFDKSFKSFNPSTSIEPQNSDVATPRSRILVNKGFAMRRAWTMKQSTAARNTLNCFIRGSERKFPMLSDLLFTKRNESMLRQFVYGILNPKAALTSEQLSSISCERFGMSLQDMQVSLSNESCAYDMEPSNSDSDLLEKNLYGTTIQEAAVS